MPTDFEKSIDETIAGFNSPEVRSTTRNLGIKFTVATIAAGSAIILYIEATDNKPIEILLSSIAANFVMNFFAGKRSFEHVENIIRKDQNATKKAAEVITKILFSLVFASPLAVVTYCLNNNRSEAPAFAILDGLGDAFLNMLSLAKLFDSLPEMRSNLARLAFFFKEKCHCQCCNKSLEKEIKKWYYISQFEELIHRIQYCDEQRIPTELSQSLENNLKLFQTLASSAPLTHPSRFAYGKFLQKPIKWVFSLTSGLSGLFASLPTVCATKTSLTKFLDLSPESAYCVAMLANSLSLALCYKLFANTASSLFNGLIDFLRFRQLSTETHLDGKKLTCAFRFIFFIAATTISLGAGAASNDFYQESCLPNIFFPDFLRNEFFSAFSYAATDLFYVIVSYLVFENARNGLHEHFGKNPKRVVLKKMQQTLESFIQMLKNTNPDQFENIAAHIKTVSPDFETYIMGDFKTAVKLNADPTDERAALLQH